MQLDGTDADRRRDEVGAPLMSAQGGVHDEPKEEGKKRHDTARMLWTELLARLTHVADELTRPETVSQLREMGVRGIEGALTNIAREYARASQIALATGAAPRPHEIMNRARGMALMHDLRFDYLELAKVYRLLKQELGLPEASNRCRWLEGRAQLHQSQANELERQR